jgi:Fe2+ or Zn2+ uptake regulation protein
LSDANVLLKEIVAWHPTHLTSEELVTRLEDDESKMGCHQIMDALAELRRSGLVRTTGSVVEATHAALRANAIFQA